MAWLGPGETPTRPEIVTRSRALWPSRVKTQRPRRISTRFPFQYFTLLSPSEQLVFVSPRFSEKFIVSHNLDPPCVSTVSISRLSFAGREKRTIAAAMKTKRSQENNEYYRLKWNFLEPLFSFLETDAIIPDTFHERLKNLQRAEEIAG